MMNHHTQSSVLKTGDFDVLIDDERKELELPKPKPGSGSIELREMREDVEKGAAMKPFDMV